jgi:hypothetical protein
MEADLSGQVNGLLYLSSLSLGLTQYFSNNQRIRFTEIRDRVRKASDIIGEDGTDQLIDRETLQHLSGIGDNLSVQPPPNVGTQVVSLFMILCLSGFVKAVETSLLLMDYLEAHSWWLRCFLYVGLLVVTIALFMIVVWTGAVLIKVRNRLHKLQIDSDAFVLAVRVLSRRRPSGTSRTSRTSSR